MVGVQGVQGGNPQAAAVGWICANSVGASTDVANVQEDVSVDEEELLELRGLHQNRAFETFALGLS